VPPILPQPETRRTVTFPYTFTFETLPL